MPHDRKDRKGKLGRVNVAPAFFSFASNVFNGLGAFFCSFGQHRNLCRCFGASAGVAPGQPRARVLDLVGSRLPRPYHFPARIQGFQAVAAPFPGDSILPRASTAAIPTTETPRFPFGVHIRHSLLTIRLLSTCAVFRVTKNYHDTLWYFRKEKSSGFQTATTSRSARDATHPEASREGND